MNASEQQIPLQNAPAYFAAHYEKKGGGRSFGFTCECPKRRPTFDVKPKIKESQEYIRNQCNFGMVYVPNARITRKRYASTG
jgi:hypothetical protein